MKISISFDADVHPSVNDKKLPLTMVNIIKSIEERMLTTRLDSDLPWFSEVFITSVESDPE